MNSDGTGSPHLEVYEDLMNAREFTHAWKPPESFPLESLDAEGWQKLSSICGVEAVFHGTQGDETRTSQLFSSVSSFLGEALLSHPAASYLFTSEHQTSLRNRVRSHKGLLRPEGGLGRGQFIEHELDCGGEQTLILGAAELTPENIAEAFELFTDSDRSFILTSSEPEVLSAAFLTRIASLAMKLPGYVQLNYLQLILNYCPHGDLIWRMGGDGGDQQVSIQVFAPRQEKPAIVSYLRSLAAKPVG